MRGLVRVLFVVLLGAAGVVVAAPVGQAMAVTNGDVVFSDGDLFLVHSDGTGVRQLTSSGDANNPSWSPDGESVAYDHAGDIWVLTLGQRPRRITFNGVSSDPTWSADGSTIAYSKVVRLYLRDIFVVPAAGGTATRVSWMASAGCTSSQPTWAPSTSIFYVRDSATSQCAEGIYRQRVGQPAQLAVADALASGPDVSTDNQHLLFLAPCDPNFCNGDEGWMTTMTGGNRRPVADHYLCAEGDLCLRTVVASPAGGWVDAATYATDELGLVETCLQGAHFVSGVIVDTAPQFCLSRPVYDFDVQAG